MSELHTQTVHEASIQSVSAFQFIEHAHAAHAPNIKQLALAVLTQSGWCLNHYAVFSAMSNLT